MTDDTSQDVSSKEFDEEAYSKRKRKKWLQHRLQKDPNDIDARCRWILDKAELSNYPPKPVTEEVLKKYHDAGVIPKSDLVDGAYYWGTCRNAEMARWDAQKNVFWYIRDKWHDTFVESINVIEDDDGYDLFLPIKKVGW